MTTQLKKAGTFKDVRAGLQRNVAQAKELAGNKAVDVHANARRKIEDADARYDARVAELSVEETRSRERWRNMGCQSQKAGRPGRSARK